MVKDTEIRDRLSKKIKQIPSEKLQVLEEFILKLENSTKNKEDILSFAGVWNDIEEELMQEFTGKLISRRENSKRGIDG